MFRKIQLTIALTLVSFVHLNPIYGAGMETPQPPLPHHKGDPEMHPFTFTDPAGHTVEGYYYMQEVPCPKGLKPQKPPHSAPGHPSHSGGEQHTATLTHIPEPKEQHATVTPAPKPQQATITEPQQPKKATRLLDIPDQVRIDAEAKSEEKPVALATPSAVMPPPNARQQALLEQAGKVGKAVGDLGNALPETQGPQPKK